MTRNFCQISRGHLTEILDQSRGSLDVAQLTHALTKTVEFEKEMHARFAPLLEEEADAGKEGKEEEVVGDPDGATEGAKEGKEGKEGEEGKGALLHSISSSFDSYMGIYVALEVRRSRHMAWPAALHHVASHVPFEPLAPLRPIASLISSRPTRRT